MQTLEPGLRLPERRRPAARSLVLGLYDFANSGYTTVVITAVFNAYFVAVVAGNATWATFAWTAALSVSYAVIIVTAPLIGAWADAHAAKKRAARRHHARLRRRNRGAVFRRAGGFRHRDRGAGDLQLLLRHRREPDRRLPARTRQGLGAGQGLRVGLEPSATSAAF